MTIPTLSATVLCARPVADSYELLFAKRPSGSRFGGGQFVFPGGKVDDADSGEMSRQVLSENNDDFVQCDPDKTFAVKAAAIREIYEEVGLLLGYTESTAPLGQPEKYKTAESFYAALKTEGLTIDISQLAYWNNWITPDWMPVRFDTFFFIALVSERAETIRHPTEIDELMWAHPAEALERYKKGDLQLMFPTYKNIEQLASIKKLGDLTEFAEKFPKTPVHSTLKKGDSGRMSMDMPDFWPDTNKD